MKLDAFVEISVEIASVSAAAFLFASGIFGIAFMGPMGFFAAPVLALFGWPFFPVVMIGFTTATLGWHFLLWNRRYVYCLIIAFLAAALFVLIGTKEEGQAVRDSFGYAFGAFIPGFLGLVFLTRKR